jgi:hypothetical protein
MHLRVASVVAAATMQSVHSRRAQASVHVDQYYVFNVIRGHQARQKVLKVAGAGLWTWVVERGSCA